MPLMHEFDYQNTIPSSTHHPTSTHHRTAHTITSHPRPAIHSESIKPVPHARHFAYARSIMVGRHSGSHDKYVELEKRKSNVNATMAKLKSQRDDVVRKQKAFRECSLKSVLLSQGRVFSLLTSLDSLVSQATTNNSTSKRQLGLPLPSTEFLTSLTSFQSITASFFSTLSILGDQHDGLENFDPSDALEVLIKDVVNAIKYTLTDVDQLVYGIPVVGPILFPGMYLMSTFVFSDLTFALVLDALKCLIENVIDFLENTTDGLLNSLALDPILAILNPLVDIVTSLLPSLGLGLVNKSGVGLPTDLGSGLGLGSITNLASGGLGSGLGLGSATDLVSGLGLPI
jgi:hypothetical protein